MEEALRMRPKSFVGEKKEERLEVIDDCCAVVVHSSLRSF